jgi:hypothetical protein
MRMKRKDPLSELPPPFCGKDFLEALAAFEGQRIEKRKPITPIARMLLFRKLANWGEERATAALLHSAECNYQGCFEPPPNRSTNGNGYQPSSKASRTQDAFVRARMERAH